MEIVINIPKEYVSEDQYKHVIESIDAAINKEDVPQFDMEYDEYND